MEPRPDPPPWLPVARPTAPPPAVPDPPQRPRFTWQRLTKTRRGAAGLAIGSAALLLWPFSGWSWIPWLIGLGVLVLLRLLRLDGLLRGWIWHLGGLVVVAGLMYSTSPWAWAFAASIGVLVAGLLQLPWWRLAAVGVVMCAVSGVGFGIATYQTQQEKAAAEQQVQRELQGQQGAARPQGVLADPAQPDRAERARADLRQPARRSGAGGAGRVDGPSGLPGAAVAALSAPGRRPGEVRGPRRRRWCRTATGSTSTRVR